MTPVTEDETETFELFTHNKSAREAVDHARKVRQLTGGAGSNAADSRVTINQVKGAGGCDCWRANRCRLRPPPCSGSDGSSRARAIAALSSPP